MVEEKTLPTVENKSETQKVIDDKFIRAARDGKLYEVEILRKIVSDINIVDGYGKSALYYSLKNRHEIISDFLFIEGAGKVNDNDNLYFQLKESSEFECSKCGGKVDYIDTKDITTMYCPKCENNSKLDELPNDNDLL